MPTPIKVGLIGYGFSTKSFHLPFILPNPDLTLHAFLQRAEAPKDPANTPAGQHCTVDYPKAKHYRTPEAFFGDEEIDLVIVCTGHDSHHALASAALNAAKHCVVEKAFTLTSAEADDLCALARKTGKLLTVYQNRRYDSDFRTVRKLVEKGAFGKVTEFENRYDLNNPAWVAGWRDPELVKGAGMLYGLGTHTIDQCLVLFGRPASVTCVTRSLRGVKSKTDDTFTLLLQYPAGSEVEDLVCTVKTTIKSPMPLQLAYLVRGETGSFVKYGDDVQESQLPAGLRPGDKGFGIEPESYHGVLSTVEKFATEGVEVSQERDERTGNWSGKVVSEEGSYCDYYVDLVKAIRGEAELVVRPETSRDGIRVIELAHQSAEERVTVAWS